MKATLEYVTNNVTQEVIGAWLEVSQPAIFWVIGGLAPLIGLV